MKGKQLPLHRKWTIGERIGGGGFGQVFAATADSDEAVVKLVPKVPGADRELLFVDVGDARNVVPIIDSGEYESYWALVMPRADMSLREYLTTAGAPRPLEEAVAILSDICDALVDLNGRVVHRDLKPANVLRLNDRWCLADFGISRYAEATTAPDTQKFALSPPYAAPERWRSERATAATDVYSLGVIAHELLAGTRPFPGPAADQFREQHLHADPPHLSELPAPLAALIDECLYKPAQARPSAANILARLQRVSQAPTSGGISRLQEANRSEARRQGDAARQRSEAQTEAERREALDAVARHSYDQISSALREAITDAAPSVSVEQVRGTWTLRLHQAELRMSALSAHSLGAWGEWDPPAFDVICYGWLNLRIPPNRYEYDGRSHSLWYGDIKSAGEYGWYESAFMVSALMARRGRQNPFSLDPGEEAAKAVWRGMAEYQVAWPFTPLVAGELDDFVDRWAGWFADAAEGRLGHPGTMPERPIQGSWRQ